MSEAQLSAENRRFSQRIAGNRRSCRNLFVPFSLSLLVPALNLRPSSALSNRDIWRHMATTLTLSPISSSRSICQSFFLSLSLSLSLYVSLYLSLSLSLLFASLHLSIHLSIYPSINLSISRSTYLSIYLSIYLSMYLSIYPSFSINIHICCEVSIWAKFGHLKRYHLGQVRVVIWAKFVFWPLFIVGSSNFCKLSYHFYFFLPNYLAIF